MIDVEEILSKMNPNQKINYDRVMTKDGPSLGKKWRKTNYSHARLLCSLQYLHFRVLD